jgi:hypothetical protein
MFGWTEIGFAVLDCTYEINLRGISMITEAYVNLLNNLLSLDAELVTDIINNRLPASEEIQKNPDVVFWDVDGVICVGPLGLINAVLRHTNYIVNCDTDEAGLITKFFIHQIEDSPQA